MIFSLILVVMYPKGDYMVIHVMCHVVMIRRNKAIISRLGDGDASYREPSLIVTLSEGAICTRSSGSRGSGSRDV